VEFYNVKTRQKVEVPEGQLKKQKLERTTAKGVQVRYAVKAVVDGTSLTRFVNEQTFRSLNVPEIR
jgi:hypothetical protein